MTVEETTIQDLKVLIPKAYVDSRGYFFEAYNELEMQKLGLAYSFVQDNQSQSTYGVNRGLHFQKPPYAQAKLVRVLQGEILDVAVDIRKNSPTYGAYFSILLSAENKKQLLIPAGFAHGFSVLSPMAEVLYKCDNYYHPECDAGILFSDSKLAIDWRMEIESIIVSPKDAALGSLADLDSPFTDKVF